MSDLSLMELFFFQLFLVFINAIFACTEIAVISINDAKLKQMARNGGKRAGLLNALTQKPAQFLATIQVGITLTGFLGSAFAADNFSDKMVHWLLSIGVNISPQKLDVLSVIVITLILSYITLILGELAPKRIGMQYAEKIGLFMAYPIYVIAKIFAPIVWFLSLSTNLILRLLGIRPEDKNEKVTEEEIRIMIDVGSENGTIDASEKKMIHNVFEFDDKLVYEVMTHRTDIQFLDVKDDLKHWEKIMTTTRYSVYPIIADSSDNIVGVLRIKDYLKCRNMTKENVLKQAVRVPQFVSESLHINELFSTMQKSRTHFAVALDEYGGVAGIVTMKDLLEQLVGELDDDATIPPSAPMIEKINDTSWSVQGITPIEEVATALNVDLPTDDYDTFGGFVLSLMKNIPMNKTNIKLKYHNLFIQVTKTKRHKIETVLVRKKSTPDTD